MSESDWSKIGLAVGRLEVPLFLDDNPQVTVMEIRAKARRIKAQHGGLALIMIDYLQLMSGNGTSENRQLEVSEISRNLKVLARELEVPIVALSQLSRNLEARADKRPMLADLRESGSLEQDADVVMFLYRDEVYNPESPDKGSAEVIVAKHRSGPIGTNGWCSSVSTPASTTPPARSRTIAPPQGSIDGNVRPRPRRMEWRPRVPARPAGTHPTRS